MDRTVKSIRITDAEVIRRIDEYRRKTKEATATKAASRLIVERLAQIEMESSIRHLDLGVTRE